VIFVTVGSDVPFDRLVMTVDEWAGRTGRRDVFAQIGHSQLRPRHIEYADFLEPRAFTARVSQSSVMVAHAGMGSILTALSHRKPILVMPRRAALGETRSDHQVATARELEQLARIAVASDEVALADQLSRIDSLTAGDAVAPYAQPQLIRALKAFIHQSAS
jgi:UDP-N-acetylglucosamine transferase subunit ALG13